MKDFLLEIGCENIPASYIPPAVTQLRRDIATRLEELRLPFEEIYTSGTPRRFVLMVKGLATVQKSKVDTVTGPPVSKSYTDDGSPTKAAIGFAKSHGLSIDKLEKVQTEKGLYLGFKKRHRGLRTVTLLKKTVPELIFGLKFPKTMRWEAGGTRFARPIRWIVCLYGDSVVRFKFAGVTSGNTSFYVPWLQPSRIRIRSAGSYLDAMTKASIIVDQDEREQRIRHLSNKAAKRVGYSLIEAPDLIKELTFMLEDPRVFIGSFPEKYLSLPPEVVVTAMKSHQRYLALKGKRNELVPKFIGFSESATAAGAEIKDGNERVLKARLEDAFFYWQEDLKHGIEKMSSMLGNIVFLEKLGTLKDKAGRLESLMRFLNGAAPEGSRIPGEKIKRASVLAKADLASEMVKDGKEFTLLEGLIGSHYASASGEDEEVISAIREQYQPRFPSDPLPEHPLGELLTIADRIDTVCGCFLVGLLPTGSGDPYGLRRLSNGLLRIAENKLEVRIDALIEEAIDAYARQGFADASKSRETSHRLNEFFSSRCEAFLLEKGFPYDVVRAVTRVAWPQPGIAAGRCRGMERLRGDAAFERLIIGVKRVSNILDAEKKIFGSDWGALKQAFFSSAPLHPLHNDIRFSSGLFEDSMEENLLEAVKERFSKVAVLDGKGEFLHVFKTLSGLGPSIDAYFDAVLVNCENLKIRTNRIHFLACIFALFSRFADFSFIVESGPSID